MRYPRFVKSGIWFLIISLPGVITAPLQPEESNPGSVAILKTFPIQKDELFTASIQYPSLTSNKKSGESKLLRKKRKGATAPTIPETTLPTDEFTRPFIGYSDSSSSLQSAKVKLPLPESDKASKSLPPSAPPSESFVQAIRKRTTADETNPRAKEATVWQDPTDVKPTTKEEGNNKNTIATPTHGKADESRPTVYKSVQDDLEVKPGEKMLPVSPRNPGGEMRVRWHLICEPMERMLAKFYEGYFPRQHESWWRARLHPGYDLAGDFRAFEARCRTQPCACREQGTWATRFTCVNPEGDINLSLSQMQTLSSTCRRRHGCRCEAEGYTDPPDPPIPQPVDEPSNFQGGLREPGARANEAYWSTVNKAFSDFSNYRSGNRQYTHEQHGVMESLPTESYLAPGTKEPFYLSGPEGYREVAPWSSFTDLRSVQGLGSTLSKRSAGSESGDTLAEQDEASQEPR
ncbi:hypothetical protein TWF173_001058 [Orbilia oligospora]|nr:hypothetical protein TWF173_001058 [Orbilia oligospora]